MKKHAKPGGRLSIDDLRAALRGRVIVPGEPDYDKARTTFYGGIDRHPAVIVKVADPQDVSKVVSLAREDGIELAVRGGGHSIAGHCVSEGGIVIDFSERRSLRIDPVDRTAWAETGVTAGEYTTAAARHGLATGFGDAGSVGIGGITLSGGIGFLVRKHGLTIDSLLAAEIVTADGRILQVDESHHPDLFWAIRGGGGNFGVVTRLKLRLHDLKRVIGGMLILPATLEVITGFMEIAHAAPEELSTIANVMVAPPMPFFPAEIHGKLVVMAQLVYAGDGDAGERVVADFRKLAPPLVDMVKSMPYPEIYPPEDPDYHPLAAGRTMFLDSFTSRKAETILSFLNSSTALMRVAQLRVLGGAMARVREDATAFAHRSRAILANVAALYQSPDEQNRHLGWVEQFATSLRDGEGAYVGFLGDEGEDRVREAYPGRTWDRLSSVKRTYDPTNLFRLNQNIPPSEKRG